MQEGSQCPLWRLETSARGRDLPSNFGGKTGARVFPKSGVAQDPVQNEDAGPSLGKQDEKTRERQVLRYRRLSFFGISLCSCTGAVVPVNFTYKAPAQRQTERRPPELGAPSDPAGLGPTSGPGSHQRHRETRVKSWSGRMSLPGREQPCSGHSAGCWWERRGTRKRDPDTWEWG